MFSGPIDVLPALLFAPLNYLYQAPGRIHSRPPLSRQLCRCYFPVRGASGALRVGPPRVGLGGYAPLPTTRDSIDSQGTRDHPTGKWAGIADGRLSMRRPLPRESEAPEGSRTSLDAARGPPDDTWPAERLGETPQGSVPTREFTQVLSAGCIDRCSGVARRLTPVCRFGTSEV